MSDQIKYHPGFVGGLGVLLWQYRDAIEIDSEKWLSKEGIRMDVLVIKKDPEILIDNDMCRIFKRYNILEYKRPDDDLSIDVYAKVLAYAYLYKSLGVTVNQIPFEEMTVTVYRHSYPRSLFEELGKREIEIQKCGAGIYRLEKAAVFPVQVIVGKELPPREYAMFRVLTPNASREDLSAFNDMAFRITDTAYKRYVDSIFQVSFSANRPTYDLMAMEDKNMCEALRDFLKEDFETAEARGEIRGEIKGAIRLYRDEMNLTPKEIIDRIMKRYSLDRKAAEKYVEETLGLEPA